MKEPQRQPERRASEHERQQLIDSRGGERASLRQQHPEDARHPAQPRAAQQERQRPRQSKPEP